MTATMENVAITTDHERVLFCLDPEAGYRGVIALHSTVAGPAAGGTRLWAYAAGGVIGGCAEILGWSGETARERVERIYDTLLEVLHLAAEQDVPPHAAADRLVERRLAALTAETKGVSEWN